MLSGGFGNIFFLLASLLSFTLIVTLLSEESNGVSSTQTAAGSDTAEGTEKTTVLVQMEEEKRAIRATPFLVVKD